MVVKLKIYKDYNLSELGKLLIGEHNALGLSPKIEEDNNSDDKYKLRTYVYDEDKDRFDTKQPIHLAYGSYNECKEILYEFNVLIESFKDYNLVCSIIHDKYVNSTLSKAMKKSALYKKYNLKNVDNEDKKDILDILKSELGE